MPMPTTTPDLDAIFTYHPPHGDQAERYADLRQAAKFFAFRIVAQCPDSHLRTLALDAVQHAVMCANAAIAIHDPKTGGGSHGQQG